MYVCTHIYTQTKKMRTVHKSLGVLGPHRTVCTMEQMAKMQAVPLAKCNFLK